MGCTGDWCIDTWLSNILVLVLCVLLTGLLAMGASQIPNWMHAACPAAHVGSFRPGSERAQPWLDPG